MYEEARSEFSFSFMRDGFRDLGESTGSLVCSQCGVPMFNNYIYTIMLTKCVQNNSGNTTDRLYTGVYTDLQRTYHTVVVSRNEILSNLTTAEGYLRISLQWLDALRKTVDHMNTIVRSLETQLGSGAVTNGTSFIA